MRRTAPGARAVARFLAASISAASAASAPLLACSDGGASPQASPSASAPPPPRCTEALPEEDRERRCVEGETLCCTAMMSTIPKSSPVYWEKLAIACGGGAESSCEIVRDSDRPTLYKLEALDRGCTRIGRWPCRTAAMLAVLVAPERAPKIIDNYCRQTDDTTFRMGGDTIKCAGVDAAAIAPLAPRAKGCREGDLSACKSLADIDGGARELYYDVAWQARGVDRALAEQHRIRQARPSAEPKGKVALTVSDAPRPDDPSLRAALDGVGDELRACVGAAVEQGEKLAPFTLTVVVDRVGRVAYAERPVDEREDTSLSLCARLLLQDQRLGTAGPEPRSLRVRVEPRR